jgi:son of sevenless-like protein
MTLSPSKAHRPRYLSIDSLNSGGCLSVSPSDSGSFIIHSDAGSAVISPCPFRVICSVLCLHDYQPVDPDQLSFRKNEILEVVTQEESGWWAAIRKHEVRAGWIPKTFVEPLSARTAKRLRNVKECVRVFEYEAENLYSLAPVSNFHHLFNFVPSPSAGKARLEEDKVRLCQPLPMLYHSSISHSRQLDP